MSVGGEPKSDNLARQIPAERMERMMALEHEPDQAELAQILKECKQRGIEIEETNKNTFPKELNEKGFEGLSDKAWEHLVGLSIIARRYWTGLIIKDNFGTDDHARHEFQQGMKERFASFQLVEARSKLRTTLQASLYQMFRRVVFDLDTQRVVTPEANRVRELYQSLFPVDATMGSAGPEAESVRRLFPSLPPIDTYRAISKEDDSYIMPNYRTYYLDLTEEERFEIVANFDKAAHDLLALVSAPDREEKPLAE